MSHNDLSSSPLQQLLTRRVGEELAPRFHFSLLSNPVPQGDRASFEAKGGDVYIRASSLSAASRAIYIYLRNNCGFHFCWEGQTPSALAALPDCPTVEISSPLQWRHYLNACTFGYTAAFWDWERWEREIDWMALQGINLPLSLEGQEAIWQRVWKKLGVSGLSLRDHFCGPSFLAWQRMGKINGHGGPLSEVWIERRLELQRKIFSRQQELGMMPVISGFAGFVPDAIKALHPHAAIRPTSGWTSFPPTNLLDPRDPLFTQIADLYAKTYQSEIGKTSHYLVDAFMEMTPPFSEEEKIEGLESYGRSIFDSLNQADSESIWFTQGWQFISHEGRKYWGTEEVEALLRHIPSERFCMLDLACDIQPAWQLHDALSQRPWIFCFLHNFGGSTSLYGDLPFYASETQRTLDTHRHNSLCGMGITPEGIEQNSVVYGYMADLMWDAGQNTEEWLQNYVDRRYGCKHNGASAAWRLLLKSCYSQRLAFFSRSQMPDYTRRPMLNQPEDLPRRPERRSGDLMNVPPPDLAMAPQLFVEALEDLGENPLFIRDAVDVIKRYLAEQADNFICGVRTSYHLGDIETLEANGSSLHALLLDVDRLTRLCPEYRMSWHVEHVRSMASSSAEADQFQYNLQLQVTGWAPSFRKKGRVDLNLTDYGKKEWSGLIKNYYALRWRELVQLLSYQLKHVQFFNEEKWVKHCREWEDNWSSTLHVWPEDACESPPQCIMDVWQRWSEPCAVLNY